MTYYDDIAPGYDELYKEEQLKKLRVLLDQIHAPTGPILDVGCGTGFSLDLLARFNKPVTGIDPSRKLIEQYKGNQDILLGSAEMLPFDDKSFDLIISLTAIQNFSDPLQGILEMKRVAFNQAQIVISCLKRSDRLQEITTHIAENLRVENIIEEEKDMMFFCRKGFHL